MKTGMYLLAVLLFINQVYTQSHLISFIIPCYNRSYCLKQTLDSIYEQKNLKVPFEIICVDDGSTDNTYAILKAYAVKHDNILIFRHVTNQGAAAARNTAVSHARGNLIFNLDSDNILVPNSVQHLLDLMHEKGYEAVAFQEARYFIHRPDDHAGKLKRSYSSKGYFDFKDIMTDMKAPANGGNYLYTRMSYDRAGGYPDVKTGDCWGFGLRQVATGTKIGYVPGTFYWHRFSSDSNWNRWKKKGLTSYCFLKTAKEFLDFFTPETVNFLMHYPVHKRLFPIDIDRQYFHVKS
jgi:glycosyltransferase involved in cell wall biosynthesis